MWLLTRWWCNLFKDERIAHLHLTVEEHLDPVRPLLPETDVHEDLDAGRGEVRFGELYRDVLSFHEDVRFVGGDEARALDELALPAAPAVHDANFVESRRELRDGESVEESDEHEFAIALLTHVVAEDACL